MNVCLITGASSGIGMEFARQLAPRTSTLLLVARRVERLEALRTELARPGLEIHVARADLADPAELDKIARWITAFPLDGLINSAGLGDNGDFAGSDWRRVQQMIAVNMAALTRLTLAALPVLRRHPPAVILNTSSLAGLLPVPGMCVYAATKAYILSFSEGLRCELAGSGVSVTTLCPGPVPTEFDQIAVRPEDPRPLDAPDFFNYPVQKVVAEALAALRHDRPRVIPGRHIATAMTLVRFLPLPFLRWGLTNRFQNQPKTSESIAL